MPTHSHSHNISNLAGGTILEGIAIPAVFAVARQGIIRTSRKRGKGTRKNKKRRVRFSRKYR
jgi:hypothetical protein